MYRKSIEKKLFWLIFMGVASAVLTSLYSGFIIYLSMKGLKIASKLK